MVKKIILLFLLTTSIFKINNYSNNNCKQQYIKKDNKIIEYKDKEIIGKIIIKKINIEKNLYSINSKKNNIEENITILKESIFPDKDNSILFIAAHSGTGDIAYFEELDQLEIDDEITIEYNSKIYNYKVKDIWLEKKNGYINVNKDNKKQLILTTCNPKDDKYQLVINCTEKES